MSQSAVARMDDHQAEIYCSALTFSRVDGRELAPVESRYVERMRQRFPSQCSEIDRAVELDFARRSEQCGASR